MNRGEPKAYAVKHRDEAVVAASRSGGIFTALSDCVLAEGGTVYGCVLTENFLAVHMRAENAQERDRMRGSKYIQSRLGDTFVNVRTDLESERKVLFSGTSCQTAGLKRFLEKEYANLLCVDIVCHGVPSPKVWISYLRWLEKKEHAPVKTVNFRNKADFGWRDHRETIYFENGKTVNRDIFKNLFFGHAALRPCCYACPYKSVMHPGDITIADYWGIEKAAPEFDDNKGVSLVLVNNPRGEAAFRQVQKCLSWKQTKLEDSLQPALKAPSPRPDNRDQFWRDFGSRDFSYIAAKYGEYGAVNGAKRFLKRIKRKLKSMIGD